MLNMKNIKRKTSVRSKLQSPWEGPFEILVSWPSIDNVKLQLPPDWKIHDIFHTSLIKPYHSNNDERFPSRKHAKPPPIPEADPQENIYEVEAIRDHKIHRGKNRYLVKWTGWLESDNTWVTEEDMEGTKDTIKEYLDSLNLPSRKPSTVDKNSKMSSFRHLTLTSRILRNENKISFSNDICNPMVISY